MRWLALLAAVLLTGCSDEPTFDERYAKAQKQIRAKAGEIDRELRRSEPSGTPPAS